MERTPEARGLIKRVRRTLAVGAMVWAVNAGGSVASAIASGTSRASSSSDRATLSGGTGTKGAPITPASARPVTNATSVIALLLAACAGGAAVWSLARDRRQAGRFAEMSAAALIDPLTGILNRRGFTEAADLELERARRYRRPLALAYVDVRGLKAVNDSEGHLAGDRLLRAAARLLQESARTSDVVGRLGGDEMGLLLLEQTPDGAIAATKRIEAEVLRRRAAIGLQAPWDLTVGTSNFPEDGETVDELLRTADQRLYEQRGIELRGGGREISARATPQPRPSNA